MNLNSWNFDSRCPDKTMTVQCLAGYYSPGKQINCSPCPLGFQCPSDGLLSPTQCSLGRYQDEVGQSKCKDCPIGKYCNNVSASGLLCLSGSYSLGNSSVCLTCPSGHRWVYSTYAWVEVKNTMTPMNR